MTQATHSIQINQDGTYSVVLIGGWKNDEVITTWGTFATYQKACDSAQGDSEERHDHAAIFGNNIREA